MLYTFTHMTQKFVEEEEEDLFVFNHGYGGSRIVVVVWWYLRWNKGYQVFNVTVVAHDFARIKLRFQTRESRSTEDEAETITANLREVVVVFDDYGGKKEV